MRLKSVIIICTLIIFTVNPVVFANEKEAAEVKLNKCKELEYFFTDTDRRVSELNQANTNLVNALNAEHLYVKSLEDRILKLEMKLNDLTGSEPEIKIPPITEY